MRIYLDASVLVAAFTGDVHNSTAERVLRSRPVIVVSDFAAAEFASAISRQVRTRDLTVEEARRVFANFDAWTTREARRVETTPADVAACAGWLRRLDLPLRTPDALNIAIARRVDARLLTFDARMETSAKTLGVAVLDRAL
ncbi:type II toxin-antitoxin system VapC family toxin [Rhodovulum sp. PH10]|uniref:type II toxin-antitoxin system VapC family toxin n=1 Tax=Rhodovulum sp. PH10 TaxID=1187851 RepID=UPI0002DA55A3|nr:type II toxin-antitoxin system VapC family toxin [Rhodovulum sp. PH10]